MVADCHFNSSDSQPGSFITSTKTSFLNAYSAEWVTKKHPDVIRHKAAVIIHLG